MSLTRILAAAVALGLAVPCQAQPPSPRPTSAREAVGAAAAMIVDAWRLDRLAERSPHEATLAAAAASERFDALLDAAAEMTAEPELPAVMAAEGTSIEAKLLAIAVARRRHPEPFAAIRQGYVAGQPRSWRSQAAPPPTQEHASEPFRLAWELALLAPTPPKPSPAYRQSAAKAVGAIGNSASLITLRRLAEITLEEPVSAATRVRQRMVVDTLAAMPGPEAARLRVELERSFR